MPELPDVEAFKRYMDATSLHKTIEGVEVKSSLILGNASARELQARLTGHKFQSTRRYGKYLFVRVDDGFWFILHFGMSGRLKYFKNIDKDPPHDRLLISFANGFHLAYDCQRKLGKVGITEEVESFIREKDLGPDVLELDFTTLKEILEGRRGTVKYTLMNQHIIAGIGNIYSDEILFQAGVHPTTKINKLKKKMLKKLFEEMKKVLQTAIDCQTDPEKLPEYYLLQHRSKGGRCPRCHSDLERIKVSGRTAYYCPKHQKKNC